MFQLVDLLIDVLQDVVGPVFLLAFEEIVNFVDHDGQVYFLFGRERITIHHGDIVQIDHWEVVVLEFDQSFPNHVEVLQEALVVVFDLGKIDPSEIILVLIELVLIEVDFV